MNTALSNQKTKPLTITVPKGLAKERLTPKMEKEIYWKVRYEELKRQCRTLLKKIIKSSN